MYVGLHLRVTYDVLLTRLYSIIYLLTVKIRSKSLSKELQNMNTLVKKVRSFEQIPLRLLYRLRVIGCLYLSLEMNYS